MWGPPCERNQAEVKRLVDIIRKYAKYMVGHIRGQVVTQPMAGSDAAGLEETASETSKSTPGVVGGVPVTPAAGSQAS